MGRIEFYFCIDSTNRFMPWTALSLLLDKHPLGKRLPLPLQRSFNVTNKVILGFWTKIHHQGMWRVTRQTVVWTGKALQSLWHTCLPSVSAASVELRFSALSTENQENSCLMESNCAMRKTSSHRFYPLQWLKYNIPVSRAICLFLWEDCQFRDLPDWTQEHSTLCNSHAVHFPQRHSSRGTVQQCQGICNQGSSVGVFCWIHVGL